MIGTVMMTSNHNSNSNSQVNYHKNDDYSTKPHQLNTISHSVSRNQANSNNYMIPNENNIDSQYYSAAKYSISKRDLSTDDQVSVASSQAKTKIINENSKNGGIIKSSNPSNRTNSSSSNSTRTTCTSAAPNPSILKHITSQRSVNFNSNSNENELDDESAEKMKQIYDKLTSSKIEQNEKIQVQILPQDDNWGENTTAVTGDFSDFNDEVLAEDNNNHNHLRSLQSIEPTVTLSTYGTICHLLHKYFGFLATICVMFCSFMTPILFIILPRLNINPQWQLNECGLECEGLLIGIAFKLFILLMANWLMFARKPRVVLPRIFEIKLLLIFLLCITTFSYWLFYVVRIIQTNTQDYYKILQFCASYVDVLLFIFIISVFLMELRHLQPQYVVRIVRSPDGHQAEYTIGAMSIQKAAVWLLEQYYKDFCVYNPWLDNAHKKRSAQLLQLEQAALKKGKRNASNMNISTSSTITYKSKIGTETFDDNTMENTELNKNSQLTNRKAGTSRTASLAGTNAIASDRFYEEYEYERRLRKRRARLMTCTEDAFAHVKRIMSEHDLKQEPNGPVPTVMDPYEAAQAIFTSIARDLRRYLRVTRQQPYFTRESIVSHLANCISYDMSPKSFLQRYLTSEPLVFNERALVNAFTQQQSKLSAVIPMGGNNYNMNIKTMDQSWILISDTVLYQGVEDNLMFVLKQNEVSLMCTFKRLPRFNIIEDILDPKRNKFVLKLNSETTV